MMKKMHTDDAQNDLPSCLNSLSVPNDILKDKKKDAVLVSFYWRLNLCISKVVFTKSI